MSESYSPQSKEILEEYDKIKGSQLELEYSPLGNHRWKLVMHVDDWQFYLRFSSGYQRLSQLTCSCRHYRVLGGCAHILYLDRNKDTFPKTLNVALQEERVAPQKSRKKFIWPIENVTDAKSDQTSKFFIKQLQSDKKLKLEFLVRFIRDLEIDDLDLKYLHLFDEMNKFIMTGHKKISVPKSRVLFTLLEQLKRHSEDMIVEKNWLEASVLIHWIIDKSSLYYGLGIKDEEKLGIFIRNMHEILRSLLSVKPPRPLMKEISVRLLEVANTKHYYLPDKVHNLYAIHYDFFKKEESEDKFIDNLIERINNEDNGNQIVILTRFILDHWSVNADDVSFDLILSQPFFNYTKLLIEVDRLLSIRNFMVADRILTWLGKSDGLASDELENYALFKARSLAFQGDDAEAANYYADRYINNPADYLLNEMGELKLKAAFVKDFLKRIEEQDFSTEDKLNILSRLKQSTILLKELKDADDLSLTVMHLEKLLATVDEKKILPLLSKQINKYLSVHFGKPANLMIESLFAQLKTTGHRTLLNSLYTEIKSAYPSRRGLLTTN